jgi:signal transduction histidine kinase
VLLDHLGYVHALRWYAGRLQERTGVALSLEVEGEDHRFPMEMEAALYRATEDALSSGARRQADMRVCYRHRPAAVQLEIAGMTPGAIELAAMRERLRPFRGTVRVSTPPDAPPVVALELPLN